ncbi:hypothetical protein HYQ46_004783 [Verticillium longisporum]|nr:hypothetical protein HYQ46_004783 [Verticillium longisporum]
MRRVVRVSTLVQPLVFLVALQQGRSFCRLAGWHTIEHIMLGHENQVVDHGHVAEGKLDGVARDARPVALQVRVDALLRAGQEAADKVQEDLQDGPALGRLVPVVGDDLGRVLDKSDDKLDVGHGIDNVERTPGVLRVAGLGGGDDERDGRDADNAANGDTEDEAAGAVAWAGGKAPNLGPVLARRDDGQDEAVRRKGYVVEGDGRV